MIVKIKKEEFSISIAKKDNKRIVEKIAALVISADEECLDLNFDDRVTIIIEEKEYEGGNYGALELVVNLEDYFIGVIEYLSKEEGWLKGTYNRLLGSLFTSDKDRTETILKVNDFVRNLKH